MIKYFTDDELEKLARRIWYAPRHMANSFKDSKGRVTSKIAHMPALGINGRESEFNARLGGRQVGQWIIDVQYPHWDFEGMITVRKVKPEPTGADAVVARIMSQPTSPRQQKDW